MIFAVANICFEYSHFFSDNQKTVGLFPRETWLDLMRENGFEVEIILDSFQRELFADVKY